jgi:hypothetical protein
MISSGSKVNAVMAWTKSSLRWFPIALVLCLAVACSGDGEPEAGDLPPGVVEGSPTVGVGGATPSSSPTTAQPTATPECPNEAAVATDPSKQAGASVAADVDGDGVSDDIHIALDGAGGEGCAAFLVIETGAGATVAAPAWEVGAQGGLPAPRINTFIDIDERAGAEVLVDEAAGASTQFVGAFMYLDEDLHRVTVEDGIGAEAEIGGASDLFPYGGSVGHLSMVDCTGEGVVIATATPSTEPGAAEEGIYEYRRRIYSFDGSVLVKEDTEVHDVPTTGFNRFPEYGGSPFGNC